MIIIPVSAAASSPRSNLRSSRQLEGTLTDGALPTFSLEFTTQATAESSQDNYNIRRIATPLTLVVGEFVLESVHLALAKPTSNSAVLWMRQHFVTLQLSLSKLSSAEITNSANTKQHERITAVFQGTAVLRTQQQTALQQPTREELDQLWQDMLRQTLSEDRSILQGYMQDSNEPLLRKASQLSTRVGDEAKAILMNGTQQHTTAQSSQFIASMVVAGVLIIGLPLAMFALKPRWSKYYPHSRFSSTSPKNYLSKGLGGRKGDDDDDDDDMDVSSLSSQLGSSADRAAKILKASERYLSQHRPEWLEDTTSSSSSPTDNGFGSPSSTTAATSPSSTIGSPRSPSSSSSSSFPESPPPKSSIVNWLQQSILTRRLQRQQQGDGVMLRNGSPYSFAFQDWSRKDGTSYIIHSKNSDDAQQDGTYSDDFIRRPDSQHEHGFSPEDAEAFMDKLEYLMEMKFQKYQKERYTYDDKFRAQDEARQRDLLLRRHEMELDLKQIERLATAPYQHHHQQQQQQLRQPESDFSQLQSSGHRANVSAIPAFGTIKRDADGFPTEDLNTSGSSESAVSQVSAVSIASTPPRVPSRPPRGKSSASRASSVTRGRQSAPSQGRSRRSHSHGTNARRRRGTDECEDNVMTLGIAAYSAHFA
jgi:hypothetical protein